MAAVETLTDEQFEQALKEGGLEHDGSVPLWDDELLAEVPADDEPLLEAGDQPELLAAHLGAVATDEEPLTRQRHAPKHAGEYHLTEEEVDGIGEGLKSGELTGAEEMTQLINTAYEVVALHKKEADGAASEEERRTFVEKNDNLPELFRAAEAAGVDETIIKHIALYLDKGLQTESVRKNAVADAPAVMDLTATSGEVGSFDDPVTDEIILDQTEPADDEAAILDKPRGPQPEVKAVEDEVDGIDDMVEDEDWPERITSAAVIEERKPQEVEVAPEASLDRAKKGLRELTDNFKPKKWASGLWDRAKNGWYGASAAVSTAIAQRNMELAGKMMPEQIQKRNDRIFAGYIMGAVVVTGIGAYARFHGLETGGSGLDMTNGHGFDPSEHLRTAHEAIGTATPPNVGNALSHEGLQGHDVRSNVENLLQTHAIHAGSGYSGTNFINDMNREYGTHLSQGDWSELSQALPKGTTYTPQGELTHLHDGWNHQGDIGESIKRAALQFAQNHGKA